VKVLVVKVIRGFKVDYLKKGMQISLNSFLEKFRKWRVLGNFFRKNAVLSSNWRERAFGHFVVMAVPSGNIGLLMIGLRVTTMLL
jgi:hypothetical protein